MHKNQMEEVPLENLVLLVLNVARMINDTQDPEVTEGLKAIFSSMVMQIIGNNDIDKIDIKGDNNGTLN